MVRVRSVIAVCVLAVAIASCRLDEDSDPAQPEIIRADPTSLAIAQGSSATLRVDLADRNNRRGANYRINLDEQLSKIDIRTAPCPHVSERPACEDWTFTVAPDAVPGEYPLEIQLQRFSGPASPSEFVSVRVIASPAPRLGAALEIFTRPSRLSQDPLAPPRPLSNPRDVIVTTAEGRLMARGDNENGQMGVGYLQLPIIVPDMHPFAVHNGTRVAPEFLSVFAPVGAEDLNPGFGHAFIDALGASYAVSAGGRFWHWGNRDQGRDLLGTMLPPVLVPGVHVDKAEELRLRPFEILGLGLPPMSQFAEAVPDGVHGVSAPDRKAVVYALDSNGNVWEWGTRHNNQTSLPLLPRLLEDVRSPGSPLGGVRAIASFDLFLMEDGRVLQGHDQQPVAGLPPIVQIESYDLYLPRPPTATENPSGYGYLARGEDGSVWHWDTLNRPLPRRQFIDNAIDIALDADGVVYALRSDSGSVWILQLDGLVTHEISAPDGVRFAKVANGGFAILADCDFDAGSVWRIHHRYRQDGTSEFFPEVLPEFGVGGPFCEGVLNDVPLSVSIEGRGRIVSEPGEIDCDLATCTGTFRRGSRLRLFATPEPGWVLSSLTPASCASTDDTGIAVGAIDTCTAVFTESLPDQFLLTIVPSEGGVVRSEPQGILCGNGNAACSHWFAAGASVSIVATSNASYEFVEFTGDAECSNSTSAPGTSRFTMNAHHTCQPQFILTGPPPQPDQQLTVQVRGDGTVTGPGITCPENCTEDYPDDTVVTLTATPASGSSFQGWADGCDDIDGDACIVEMIEPRTVSAVFQRIPGQQFALEVRRNGEGEGAVTGLGINCGIDCDHAYDADEPVTLTATAQQGYSFAGWAGCQQVNINQCTVIMSEHRTVTATFELNSGFADVVVVRAGPGAAAATVVSDPAGIDCGPTCSARFLIGSQVSLTPAAGSPALQGWSGCDSLSGDECRINISGPRTVTATFNAEGFFTVNVARTGTGNGTVTSVPAGIACGNDCQGSYAGLVVLFAEADSQSDVIGWTGCDRVVDGFVCELDVTSTRNVTVRFDQ